MGELERSCSQGGCLCGGIRYRINCDPLFINVCHCTNCQKQTGAPFALHIAVPRAALVVEGETMTFRDSGDTGAAVHRVFCPNCSSPILANADLKPDISFVFASTLDDTSGVHPTAQIYCDSAQSWVELKGIQSFPRMPE